MTRPLSTWPGPSSTKTVQPASRIAGTESVQRTETGHLRRQFLRQVRRIAGGLSCNVKHDRDRWRGDGDTARLVAQQFGRRLHVIGVERARSHPAQAFVGARSREPARRPCSSARCSPESTICPGAFRFATCTEEPVSSDAREQDLPQSVLIQADDRHHRPVNRTEASAMRLAAQRHQLEAIHGRERAGVAKSGHLPNTVPRTIGRAHRQIRVTDSRSLKCTRGGKTHCNHTRLSK